MSHAISIQTVEEHIFLLGQLATAGKAYTHELITTFESARDDPIECTELDLERMRYHAHLESLVSDYLIQCATRTRIIQDTWPAEFEEGYDPDKEAYERFTDIASCVTGKVRFSIREVCNKIIHATRFELKFEDFGQHGLKYWEGWCHLHGSHQGKPWHVELNVKKWAFALQYYYEVRV